MFHKPAHKDVEHPAAQVEIAPMHPELIEGEVKAATVQAIRKGRVFTPIVWKRQSRGKVFQRPHPLDA